MHLYDIKNYKKALGKIKKDIEYTQIEFKKKINDKNIVFKK